MRADDNRSIVERYRALYYSRNWSRSARLFSADVHYADIGADPVGATGPIEVIARLSALDIPHECREVRKTMIAQGNLVVTEDDEILRFETGEEIVYPFASVIELRDGLICRWHDYGNPALFAERPASWLRYAQSWRSRIRWAAAIVAC